MYSKPATLHLVVYEHNIINMHYVCCCVWDAGVAKVFMLSENANGSEDPAGDDFPEDTCAPSMISAIKKL